MTLAFEANFVNCAAAIGGEILQVGFDSMSASENEDDHTAAYVLVSRNFEFPGSATIEWHNGDGNEGSAEILSLTLARDRVLIKVDRDLDLDVSFCLADKRFAKLTSHLKRIVNDRGFFAD